jgi:exopolysaccharide production protein ExoQ
VQISGTSSIPLFALGAIDQSISASRPLSLAALIGSFVMIVLTKDKTAMICVLSSFAITLAVRQIVLSRNSWIFAVVFLTTFILLLSIVIFDMGISRILDFMFSDPTLTGRSRIWAYLLDRFSMSPYFGSGYGAIWQTGPQVQAYLQRYAAYLVNEGHNGYLDILAQLGIVGLATTLVWLFWVCLRLFRSIRLSGNRRLSTISLYALYVFVGSIIYNLTESSYFRTGVVMWQIVLFVTVCGTARYIYHVGRFEISSVQGGLIRHRST